MSAHWKFLPLGEVCDTGAGGTPLSTEKTYYEGGTIPWLQSGEVAQGEITCSKNFITEIGLDNSSARVFPENTVLVAMYGATAGQVGILRIKAATNQAVCGILPNNRLLPEFIYYTMLSKQEELISKAAGNAQPNISQIKVKNTIIPVPPLPEQKRIVAILDEAFAGIAAATANTEKNLANTGELFVGYLNAIFSQRGNGWEETTISQVCDLISGQHIDADDYNNEGRGMGYLTGPSDFGDLSPVVTKWTEVPKRTALKGDILITVKGSGVGKINLLTVDEVAISRQLMAIRVNGVHSSILYAFLSMQFDYFQSLANGAAIPGISRHDVLDLKLSVPNCADEEAVLVKIDRIASDKRRLETLYSERLSALAELKQAILQKAFSGELTAKPEDSLRAAAE